MTNDSILNNVVDEMKRYGSIGFKNWYTDACALAKSYDIDLDNMRYTKASKNKIRCIVRETFIKNWHNNLNNIRDNPILRVYSLYKYGFKMENHLSLVTNPKYRNAISKLRCNSHLLHIERGRHTKPKTPIEKRTCHLCNVLEDEIHFITECMLYECERRFLYQKVNSYDYIFEHLSNQEKFIYLLRSANSSVLSHLGKYIYDSFMKRDSSMMK